MSKINLNHLDDYYEEEGYELCPKCGSTDFFWFDDLNTDGECNDCGHTVKVISKPKKINKGTPKKFKNNSDDL